MAKPIRLYHYASTPLAVIKTARQLNKYNSRQLAEFDQLAKEQLRPGSYADHISFFFSPIPAKFLGSLFPETHSAWATGNRVIEHVVHLTPQEFSYRIVETPLATCLRTSKPLDAFDLNTYFKVLKEMLTRYGEEGGDFETLRKQAIRFAPCLAAAFAGAAITAPEPDNRMKYAANVPHLMLYPETDSIPVLSKRPITIEADEDASHQAYMDYLSMTADKGSALYTKHFPKLEHEAVVFAKSLK